MWLDGLSVSIADAKPENCTIEASKLIRKCKQFSQLHVILLSPRLSPVRGMSTSDLARRVKLPVIAIRRAHKSSRRANGRSGCFAISIGGKHVTLATVGVKRKGAESLYRIGCSPYGIVPEAVRVADLLAEELNRTFPK
jgi:endonuclease V-like protein UPF0215 family